MRTPNNNGPNPILSLSINRSSSSFFSFHPVSDSDIENSLKEMSFKSCDLDPIPASVISQCLPRHLTFITGTVNSSLLTGPFPSAFKTAIVRPALTKQQPRSIQILIKKNIVQFSTFHSSPNCYKSHSQTAKHNLLHPSSLPTVLTTVHAMLLST